MSDNNKTDESLEKIEKRQKKGAYIQEQKSKRAAGRDVETDKRLAAKAEREKQIYGDKENRRIQSNKSRVKAEAAAAKQSELEFNREKWRLENLAKKQTKTNTFNRSLVRTKFSGSSFLSTYSMMKSGFTFSRLSNKKKKTRLNGVRTKQGLSAEKARQKNNFASVSGTWHKKSKAVSVLKHTLRKELERLNPNLHENVIEGLTEMNFDFEFETFTNMARVRKQMVESELKEQAHLKKYFHMKTDQAHEKSIYEQFLILSEHQYMELEKELGAEDARIVFALRVKENMKKMKNEYGFEPMAFSLHFDEGHIDPETGNFTRNIHAHALYYNWDFENCVKPTKTLLERAKADPDYGSYKALTKLGVEQQDIWTSCVDDLGFQRGKKMNL